MRLSETEKRWLKVEGIDSDFFSVWASKSRSATRLAVIDVLLNGMTQSAAAKKHDISRQAVSSTIKWLKEGPQEIKGSHRTAYSKTFRLDGPPLTSEDAKSIFHRVYKGAPNILTPDVHAYGSRLNGAFVYEISSGTGMEGDRIFAVTVLKYEDGEYVRDKEHSTSSMCSIDEAKAYIRQSFTEKAQAS